MGVVGDGLDEGLGNDRRSFPGPSEKTYLEGEEEEVAGKGCRAEPRRRMFMTRDEPKASAGRRQAGTCRPWRGCFPGFV